MTIRKPPITITAIEFGLYPSGELAMEIIDRDGSAYPPHSIPGEKLCTATVALGDYGHPKPKFGCVWLKTWSENEGVAEALIAGGIVELTGRTLMIGFNASCAAREARLTSAALDALKAQGGSLPQS